MEQLRDQIGIVVIGRDEGALLERCLRSFPESGSGPALPVVYADSASVDDSVVRARALGADVVELDESRPHTPGRGRNAGARRLLETHPGLVAVQFVDGDCELVAGWLERAARTLAKHPDVGIVTGRLRERDRERNVWHRLADMEWDSATGEVDECGGIALYRASVWQASGGFDEAMPGGEEPELCLRVRNAGHRVIRLSQEMATHDADMDRFAQWWRRGIRSGRAYAEGWWRHRGTGYRTRELRSILFWALLLPILVLFLAVPTRGLSLLLLAGYPLLWLRVRAGRRRRGDLSADTALYASAVLAGKFAQAVGLGSFLVERLRGARTPGGAVRDGEAHG